VGQCVFLKIPTAMISCHGCYIVSDTRISVSSDEACIYQILPVTLYLFGHCFLLLLGPFQLICIVNGYFISWSTTMLGVCHTGISLYGAFLVEHGEDQVLENSRHCFKSHRDLKDEQENSHASLQAASLGRITPTP
jgi:hypothetical protein